MKPSILVCASSILIYCQTLRAEIFCTAELWEFEWRWKLARSSARCMLVEKGCFHGFSYSTPTSIYRNTKGKITLILLKTTPEFCSRASTKQMTFSFGVSFGNKKKPVYFKINVCGKGQKSFSRTS